MTPKIKLENKIILETTKEDLMEDKLFSEFLARKEGDELGIYCPEILEVSELVVEEMQELSMEEELGDKEIKKTDYPTLYCLEVIKHFMVTYENANRVLRYDTFTKLEDYLHVLRYISTFELKKVDNEAFRSCLKEFEEKLK